MLPEASVVDYKGKQMSAKTAERGVTKSRAERNVVKS